jgi:hypothetical protein
MPIRIKNWSKFQHFKDRRPPWVKLYRDLLDDMEWHQLEPRAAKFLVMCWLIASENDGELPEAKTLAFRLRTTERAVLDAIGELSHWLEHDDIAPISGRYQGDAPETEKSRDKERDRAARAREFETFYAAYPKHEGRAPAEKAWAKVDAPLEVLLAAVKRQAASPNWQKDGGRYIPMPATWLNQRRWEDEAVAVSVTVPGPTGRDPALVKLDEDAKKAAPIPPQIKAQIDAALKGKVH